MITAVYPGSFDPITLGHLDIIERSSALFGKVIVGIGSSSNKNYKFSLEQRLKMVRESCSKLNNVEVVSYQGLTVEFAKRQKAQMIIRGLRTSLDFVYEQQMFETNKTLNSEIETIYLPTKKEYSHISSTLVREIIDHKGQLENLVPKAVLRYIV